MIKVSNNIKSHFKQYNLERKAFKQFNKNLKI